MATYAIGDLQGCCDPLEQLLQMIRFDSAVDRLWFVGDLVNRGPQSLQTLRRIIQLGNAATVVLGNHDLHLLAASIGVRPLGKSDTLNDILAAPDVEELLHWLRHRKLAHRDVVGAETCLMVHAGVLPEWNADDVMTHAAEFEATLQGRHWQDMLAQLFGNRPDHWDAGLRGNERLRVIVNACTRLRFCTPSGQMDFVSKDNLASAPHGHLPWFDVPRRRSSDTTIVFGHWSTLGLVMRPNLLALDTGCVWGGQLSAVRLEDRALFQVPCEQALRPG